MTGIAAGDTTTGSSPVGPDRPDLALLDGVRWRGSDVSGERLHALLAALVLHAGHAVSDQRLIDEIWADEPPSHPTKALQVLVSRVRAQVGPEAVTRIGNGYRLGLPDACVDVLALQAHLSDARRAWNHDDPMSARDSARRASLFDTAGESRTSAGALADVRTRARQARDEARVLLGLALGACAEHREALTVLEEVLPAHPEDEPLVEALLRSEAVVRGAPVALDRYETYRRTLQDRLGTDPGEGLQRLHAELLARDQQVRAGVLFDHNRLIGRAGDIVALTATMRMSRVTSIVGAGGLGKTRLAHVIGRDAEQPTVHFVELAGVTSPDGVVIEVGSALGVRDSLTSLRTQTPAHRADARARIVEKLGVAPSLLILDNCEHVLDAVADLVAVLVAGTRQLTVLTTSRAPLGLASERVYLLPELGDDDGVQLFRERATAARPGVLLSDVLVRDLVHRLDGLPLAIELAAAKARVMSVEEIGRRLEHRFELLRGGDRAAPARHQTLLAVIDWSWNLLDEPGRLALRRLSVFRDGFSLDGASAVVGDGADPLPEVEDLVEQSLLTVHELTGGVRYRLLETVREFGRMHLVDSGEDQRTDRALRGWAVGFCAAADKGLFSPDQATVMDQVREEEGNLTDVLRRAISGRDPATVVRVMATLGAFWSVEGGHVKVLSLGEAVEEALRDFEPPAELEDATRDVLSLLIINATIIGGPQPAPALDRLRKLGRSRTDRRVAAGTSLALALADAATPDALDELCESEDPLQARLALQWASHLQENAGEIQIAKSNALRALDLCDDLDGPFARAALNNHVSWLALQTGDLLSAKSHALRALAPLERLRSTDDLNQLKVLLAMCDIVDGDLDMAGRRLDDIGRVPFEGGTFGSALMAGPGRAELALARGEVSTGLRLYRDAVVEMREVRFPLPEEPHGVEPWMLFAEAATLTAYVVHGDPAGADDLHRELVAKTAVLLSDRSSFLDYPVTGSLLFAVAMSRLARATPEDAAQNDRAVMVLALADRFAYNRMFPSMAWSHAVDLAERVAPGLLSRQQAGLEGKASELRDLAARLVAEL